MDVPHILLVDDDLALLQALPHMIALRIHGVKVDTSDSATQALEQIRAHDYDAIVSDIKMPGMDGLELLVKIQELRPALPTLLITGHADQALITQALRNGAYDFIQKPIDRVSFVAALHRAIQTRQLRRQVQEQQQALALHAQTLERLVEQRTRELLTVNETMDALVRDLLDYSLIASNELVLHTTRCNLVELCQQVLEAYTAGAGLTLAFESDAEPVEVEVDRERISQALIHLLSYARGYSAAGTPIAITLHQEGGEAIVRIRGSEVRMTDELLSRIFEPFNRMHVAAAQAGAHPDIGLGLYLSREFVERHNGHIEVQNSLEEGTEFTVVLPLADSLDDGADDMRFTEPTPFPPPRWLVR